MTDAAMITEAGYFGELVRPAGKYRCWQRQNRTWCCIHTSDSKADCKRHGGLILKYPDTPADHPVAAADYLARAAAARTDKRNVTLTDEANHDASKASA